MLLDMQNKKHKIVNNVLTIISYVLNHNKNECQIFEIIIIHLEKNKHMVLKN